MSPSLSAAVGVPAVADDLRVMVVDDSAVVRGLIARWIEEEPGLVLAASLRTGRDAINQFERADPDVVLLDIDMPDLDGLSALPLLLQKKRDLVVIMASTLTRRNAEVSLRALSLGAADYIPKPETTRSFSTSELFRRELIEKVRQLGARRRRKIAQSRAAPLVTLVPARPSARGAEEEARTPIALRPFSPALPRALLIGSSTGGPQALAALMPGLATLSPRVPILITQHMPPTFTTILAEHLTRSAGRPVREAIDGDPVSAGAIYVAPGAHHMRVARRDGVPVIELDDGPPINFCKPAVDPLFASAAGVWGSATLALVLTGMGSDGARGAAAIAEAGGSIIAQDEESSVVWGMPGAAAHAGVCSAVLPLDQIAQKVVRLFAGDRA